jgi:hypothetical protein
MRRPIRMIPPLCNNRLSVKFDPGELPLLPPGRPGHPRPRHILGNRVEPGHHPAPPVGKPPGGAQQALPLKVSLIWWTVPSVTVSV